MILSKSLFGCDAQVSVDDYNQLLEESKNHAVVTLAYSAIDKSEISVESSKQWSDCSAVYYANTIRVIYNHIVLHKWMKESSVPYVILKGCSSASYYPKPYLRTMGDVDFLVPIQFLKKAESILNREGMTLQPGDQSSHLAYARAGMEYELHFSLVGMPYNDVGELLTNYFQDIFESSSEIKIGNGYVNIPSPFHHGIILLLHTCQHLTGEGIGLRHLCDWAVFANSFSDIDFCSLFEDRLKQVGLWRFAQVLTRTSIKYLGADEKEWAQCDESLADALIEDILESGNFGRRNSDVKSVERMLIHRANNSDLNRGIIHNLTKSVNELVYRRWPSSQKIKILLPVGWLYFGGRRILREIVGKRKKTSIKQVVDNSQQRQKLYQQLKLYEIDSK